ncbi:hypothetical protein [Bifidobacterium biavatii]|uniref:Glycosyl hydrolase family 25 n=1 Tax=Bifidobacterium biavatii DSM 23969 TaxID=1437608 RepID=A0A086ZN35_9BIFI|nr:hypothetical protein [Bifidobacterium biavatii]KFI47935.1 glycosyl hydrolase family 25 [Bifidobacterium biavatii DSM 23969]
MKRDDKQRFAKAGKVGASLAAAAAVLSMMMAGSVPALADGTDDTVTGNQPAVIDDQPQDNDSSDTTGDTSGDAGDGTTGDTSTGDTDNGTDSGDNSGDGDNGDGDNTDNSESGDGSNSGDATDGDNGDTDTPATNDVTAAQVAQGSAGFFKWIAGSTDTRITAEQKNAAQAAYQLLTAADSAATSGFGIDGNIIAQTKLGQDKDATSLDNTITAAKQMHKFNDIRAQYGLDDATVNIVGLAIAQYCTNVASQTGTHSCKSVAGSENLGWGYTGDKVWDAWMSEESYFDSWMAKQDEATQNEVNASIKAGNLGTLASKYPELWWTDSASSVNGGKGQGAGHYLNLISGGNASFAFAVNDKSSEGYRSTQGWRGFGASGVQNAGVSYTASFTVDQYVSLLDEYDALAEPFLKAPVYRLYNPHSGLHHYTANKAESDYLDRIGWNYEGEVFNAAKSARSGQAVYRVYNPNNGQHLWTLNAAERNHLVKLGWRNEGIAWYASDRGTVNVYRLYNRHTGEHMYTNSYGEYVQLGKIGWNQESVAWKGL